MSTEFYLIDYDAVKLRDMPYAEFLLTPYWKSVAAAVKERDGRRCVVCNTSKELAAHHRTYFHHGEEHLHLGDLTTLCEVCHSRHHGKAKEAPAAPPAPRPKKVRKVRKTLEEQRELKFYRRASKKLKQSAESLRALGREEVLRMLNRYQPLPPPKQIPHVGMGMKAAVIARTPQEWVQVTPQNHGKIKCFKEAWWWMKNNGWEPDRKGWAKRAMGKMIPKEFMGQ